MSIVQDTLNTIKNDLKILADNTASSIIHTDLSHVDYANNKGKFQSIGFIFNLVKTVCEWIENNPDADTMPSSFLSNTNEAAPREEAPEVHTIAIDSPEGN